MKKTTLFLKFVGESPKTKILQTLLVGREEEYTLNDIVRASKVNRQKAYLILNDMIDQNIIFESKRVKSMRFYKLNLKIKEVDILVKLFDSIVEKPKIKVKVNSLNKTK